MAAKQIMVGSLLPSGEMIHDLWSLGDTLTDPDNNPIVTHLGAGVQGDVLYHNGTAWTRLPAGTDGQRLRTQGALANPVWDNLSMAYSYVVGISPDDAGDCHFLHVNGVFDGIAAAITAANLTGGVVFIRKGAYQVPAGTTYTINNNVVVIGENVAATSITFTDNTVGASLFLASGNNIKIKDITIVVPINLVNAIYAIEMFFGDDSVLENIRFSTPGITGNMPALIYCSTTWHTKIHRCSGVYSTTLSCPLISSLGAYNLKITECEGVFTGLTSDIAIQLESSNVVTIRDCTLNFTSVAPISVNNGVINIVNVAASEHYGIKIIHNFIGTVANGISFLNGGTGGFINCHVDDNTIAVRDGGALNRGILWINGGGASYDCFICRNKITLDSNTVGTLSYGIYSDDFSYYFKVDENIIKSTDRNSHGIVFYGEGCCVNDNIINLFGVFADQIGIRVAASSIDVGFKVNNNRIIAFGDDAIGISASNFVKNATINGNTIDLALCDGANGIIADTCAITSIVGNSITATGAVGTGNPYGINLISCVNVAVCSNAIILANVLSTGIADTIASSGIASGNIVDITGGGTKYTLSGTMMSTTAAPDSYPLNA